MTHSKPRSKPTRKHVVALASCLGTLIMTICALACAIIGLVAGAEGHYAKGVFFLVLSLGMMWDRRAA